MSVKWGDGNIQAVREAMLRGVTRGAEIVRTEAVRLITEGSRSGRIYRRRGVEHQASAPGEPPASDTGALVNSGVVEIDSEALTARVVFKSDHALPLELGTEKMEPRPFLRPAVANTREQVQKVVSEELAKVVR
jgi:HK97 gp10 family phage protein